VKIRAHGALLLAALALAAGCRKPAQPAEGVWAVVNGKDVTRAEVDKYYRTQLNPDAPEPSQDEALSLKLNILDELVNNQILLQRAKTLGLEAADGEVEDKFTEFKSPYTEDEFQRQLKTRGYTVDDLRGDIRQQLSIQKVINREVVAKISVTDQDVQDFYNQNHAQFNVAEPQYRLAQIVASVPGIRRHLRVYHELDPTYFSATSKTFIGDIYKLFGFKNIADAAGASGGTDFPQLSDEYIVQQNPQVVVLADTNCCGQTPQTVAARPGWSGIAAVVHNRVVNVDDDVASRWGPRIVDFAAAIARVARHN